MPQGCRAIARLLIGDEYGIHSEQTFERAADRRFEGAGGHSPDCRPDGHADF